jgi:hypothetical protein
MVTDVKWLVYELGSTRKCKRKNNRRKRKGKGREGKRKGKNSEQRKGERKRGRGREERKRHLPSDSFKMIFSQSGLLFLFNSQKSLNEADTKSSVDKVFFFPRQWPENLEIKNENLIWRKYKNKKIQCREMNARQ